MVLLKRVKITLLLVIGLLSGCAEPQPQPQPQLKWVPPTGVPLEQLRLEHYQCERDAYLAGDIGYRVGPNWDLYDACLEAHGWRLEPKPEREPVGTAHGSEGS